MSNSLKDIKTASQVRSQDKAAPPTEIAAVPQEAAAPPVQTKTSEATKVLSFRIPWSVHREFQRKLFDAQEFYPNLTSQETMPAIIRLLDDPSVWKKFLKELER